MRLSPLLILLCFVQLNGQNGIHRITDDLEVHRIAENIYVHVSYFDLENAPHFPANGMVVVDNGKAFIIDTPWRDQETRQLIDWIQNELNATVEGCIIGHWHQDCMGGLTAIHQAGIPSYSYEKTRTIAQAKQLPLPENTFSDSLIIQLGEKQLIVKYPGAGHTVDNIVVWIPVDRVLFGGCLVKALEYHGLGYIGDAVLEEWPVTLQKVLVEFPDCQIVVPGHGEPGNLDLIRHTISLFKNN